MRGTFGQSLTIRGGITLALVALALMMRALVPAGWMPDSGRGIAITLCTGQGAMMAWVDARGGVHKGKPMSGTPADHPCAFAGLGLVADLPALLPVAAASILIPVVLPALRVTAVAIGRGLAAPPPPPTGPPASL